MRLIVFFVTILAVLISMFGCFYDIEENLYPDEATCNTADVTYSQEVLPILEQHCYVCHDARNNQGGVTLEGFSNLKQYVDNGRFLGAISWASGYSPMPKGGAQLRNCSLDQIKAWINKGAPNN